MTDHECCPCVERKQRVIEGLKLDNRALREPFQETADHAYRMELERDAARAAEAAALAALVEMRDLVRAALGGHAAPES